MQGSFKASASTWAAVAACSAVLAACTNRFCGLMAAKRSMQAGFSYAADHFTDLSMPLVIGTDSLSMALTLVAAIIPGTVVAYMLAKGTFRRGEEHGSSQFATDKDLLKFADKENPLDNVLLAKGVSLRYTRGPEFEFVRNRNIMVVGGSGSGKTRGYIKPNLMQVPLAENKGKEQDLEKYARSYFVSDPKGTTLAETAHVLARAGYEVKQFNTIDFDASNSFNPIAYIHSDEDVMSFATCLIKNTTPPDAGKSGDPFWENSEKLLYQALINYMLTEVPEEDRNLVTMCELLDMGKVDDSGAAMTGLDILFAELEGGLRFNPDAGSPTIADGASMKCAGTVGSPWEQIRDPQPNHPAVLAYNSFKSGAKETLQSIFISCKVRLAPMRSKRIQKILRVDEMHLSDFGERKMALFAVMSASDPTYNFLHALLIWQMLNELMRKGTMDYGDRGGALPVGVDFLLDEAAQFYVPNLEKTIAVVRSYNIGITVVLQSLAQLESQYHDDSETITDCCDTMVFLGGKSQKTNKSLEEQMGQQTVTTDNQSTSHSQQGGWSEQQAQHGRALMFASEISKMSQADCLIFIRGANPWKGRKYDVTMHPCYKYIDPGHKGAVYARAFDFPAYKADKNYFEAPDATLAVAGTARLYTTVPLAVNPPKRAVYTMQLQIRLRNESPGRAYDVQGRLYLNAKCLSNEGSITFPAMEPFGSASGLRFSRTETRSSLLTLDELREQAPDVLEYVEGDRCYKLHSVNLAPGEEAVLTASMAVDADDMLSRMSGASSCRVSFPWRFKGSCANADEPAGEGEPVIEVAPTGFASLSERAELVAGA